MIGSYVRTGNIYSGLWVLCAGVGALVAGVMIGAGDSTATLAAYAVFGLLAAYGILLRPYLGIVLMISCLPLLEILPSIPFAGSLVALLGALTLGSVLIRGGLPSASGKQANSGLLLVTLFTLWMLVTNPAAALVEGDRNWVFTFVQLIILAWLASRLLRQPEHHRVLMWAFSAASAISALYAIQTGSVGEALTESVRASGFVGNPNAAARYFVIGLVFLHHLRKTSPRTTEWVAAMLASGVLLVGVVYTLSRTGILLAVAAVGMLLIQGSGKQGRGRGRAALLGVVVVGVFLVPQSFFSFARTEIVESIEQGGGTVGIRYQLWDAGIDMWYDHPITGVGIGQYPVEVDSYLVGEIPSRYFDLGAHNMYVQILAETGAIGLLLFILAIWSGLRSLRSATTKITDFEWSALLRTWTVVLMVIILGGLTKHDHYDKLLWLTIGVALGLSRFSRVTKETPPAEYDGEGGAPRTVKVYGRA